MSECVRHIGLSQGRVSAPWPAWPAAATSRPAGPGVSPTTPWPAPLVADLVTLARSLAADNAATLAECVRIAPDKAGQPGAGPGTLP